MRRRRESGGALIESAMFIPVLMLLFVGMLQLGQIAYNYYSVQKIVYNLARYLGTQQGVNFCDNGDPNIVGATNYAVTGTIDPNGTPIVGGLTPDMLSIRIERYNTTLQALIPCDCSAQGCDAAQGGLPPDFIVVSIPNGFPFTISIPGLATTTIYLKPQARVPYGGT